MKKQIFENVSRAKFTALCHQIELTTGVIITKDEGAACADGYTFKWEYLSAQLQLTMHCLDKPDSVPASLIANHIVSVLGANTLMMEKNS